MERVFRLTADLACFGEAEALPGGSLVLEPRQVARDALGADYVFLASVDGGRTWREFATVFDGDARDWFQPLGSSS
jgi:hypothetical protein